MRFQRCETLVGTVINLTQLPRLKAFKLASNFYNDTQQCPKNLAFVIAPEQNIDLTLKMTEATGSLDELLPRIAQFGF